MRGVHTQHRNQIPKRRNRVILEASHDQPHVYNVIDILQVFRNIPQDVELAGRAALGTQLRRGTLLERFVETVDPEMWVVTLDICDPDTARDTHDEPPGKKPLREKKS